MITKNCLICGKEFKTYPSRIKKGQGKYCSKACADNSIPNRNCLVCGKEFKTILSQIKRNRGKYCSQNCYHSAPKSEEMRKKNGDAHIGNIGWNKGLKNCYSKETLEKMSEAKKGNIPWNKGKTNIYSKETLKKMSEANKGKISGMKGKKPTTESKRKMSEARIKYLSSGKGIFKNTSIEIAIENELREMEIKYIKQFGISGVGIVDFFLPDFNIILECDGDYWHNKIGVPQKDINRDLNAKFIYGYETLRFWEHEINESPKKCINRLLKYIEN